MHYYAKRRICRNILHGSVSLFSPSLHFIKVVTLAIAKRPGDGLIDELDSSNDIGILLGTVLFRHSDKDVNAVLVIRGVLPFNRAIMSRVVKAILRAWNTMMIDPYFQSMSSSPTDGFVEIDLSPCLVRKTQGIESPEANRNA